MTNQIIENDMQYIIDNFESRSFFKNSKILITGSGGFLGYYLILLFIKYASSLGIKKIICIDNFRVFSADWLERLAKNNDILDLHQFDIIYGDLNKISDISKVDTVIHMASIASPTFYRKYPIETVDANVGGLRKLLDYFKGREIKSFLFFSSSEVYGDPLPQFIPTSENYNGNVSTVGPRACYDEAKRFGETLCYLFSNTYSMPIKIVRPFNNYGPGLRLQDKRLPADFAEAILLNRDINIYSDGTPTRTFCYVADAIVGYLKALLYNNFDIFNIGIDEPEISVHDAANIFVKKGKRLFNYSGKINFIKSSDKDYLVNNPNRRCPSIKKAKELLDYNPSILPKDGIERFLLFNKISKGTL